MEPSSDSLLSSSHSSVQNRPASHPTLIQAHSTRTNTPRLGDFSTLVLPSISSKSQHPSLGSGVFAPTTSRTKCSDTVDSDSPSRNNTKSHVALGNFSRIFDVIGRPQKPSASPKGSDTKKRGLKMLCLDRNSLIRDPSHQGPFWTPKTDNVAPALAEKIQNIELENYHDLPELAWDSGSDVPASDVDSVLSYTSPATSASSSPSRADLDLKQNPTLYYRLQPDGQERPIPESVLPSALDEHGKKQLKAVFRTDGIIKETCPEIHENGIHVFLDMSNIHISYLSTMKSKVGIPLSARFVANPAFDLEILTEMIIRYRKVGTLRAGCSVFPGRPTPAFIETLRNLKYKIDVREKKPIQETNDWSNYGISSPKGTRYVEDLVDETLQTRIGEVFMDDPEKKGTLVMVTGDGKPAQYSDGFYKYALRALKWGWHVEVICWSSCCSSLWRELAADESIGNRFRLIELDAFLDELWLKTN